MVLPCARFKYACATNFITPLVHALLVICMFAHKLLKHMECVYDVIVVCVFCRIYPGLSSSDDNRSHSGFAGCYSGRDGTQVH